MEVAVNSAIYQRLLDISSTSISQRSWFMMSSDGNDSIEGVNQDQVGSSTDATSLLDLRYSNAAAAALVDASSPTEMPDISSYTALMESECTLEPPVSSTTGYYPNAMSGDLQDVVLASSRGKQALLHENEDSLGETAAAAAAAQIEQFLQDLPSSSESIQLCGTKRSRETLDGQLHEASSSETVMQPSTSTRKSKKGSSSAMAAVPLHEQNLLTQQQLLQQRISDEEHPDQEEAAEDEKSGLRLLGLLIESAECVSADNIQGAHSILPLVTHLSSPYGHPIQRVAAYFAEAIHSRILNACLGCASDRPLLESLFSSDRFTAAYQMFNEICPLVKFAHFTSNQAILEAFEGESSVHIIDLDIMQGLQWPALFQMLASRPSGAPASVRVTGLGSSRQMLAATGKRLSAFARSMGLPFEFVPVVDKIGSIADPRPLMVQQDGENTAVAMHCLLHNLYDITGSDARALALIGRIRPKVVTVVEQEQQLAQDGDFLSSFMDALHYYSAIFDSLSSVLPAESEDRHIVEHELLAREIRNIIGDAGGDARRRGVKLRPWRRELQLHGLEKWPLSGNAGNQANLLLRLFQACRGYTLRDEEGILKLGWKNSWLLSASAWGWPAQIHS